MIPFFTLEKRDEELRSEILLAIAEVMDSGYYIGGSYCESFENSFAKYCNVSNFVGVGNGLDAIQITLEALGLNPGDEVIVPGFTFIATWLAVSNLGLTIVPVDVRLETATIDFKEILKAVTKKTKAVVTVELFGRASLSQQEVMELKGMGLFVISDSAQAHGLINDSKTIAEYYDAATYSFYPTKNLGGLGDAGGVATNNDALAERIRLISNYGSNGTKYSYSVRGRNSRLDPIQANILLKFLPYLEGWNNRRKQIAKTYRSELRIPGNHQIGFDFSTDKSVWHHYVIRVDNRKDFIENSELHGVILDVHYPITPLQSGVFDSYISDKIGPSLKVSDELSNSVVSLPIYPHLSDSSLIKVIETVNKLQKFESG
jgi:dTDP-4-amino-4,6-dideoxygalactose transaminase